MTWTVVLVGMVGLQACLLFAYFTKREFEAIERNLRKLQSLATTARKTE